jgi:RNA polymerase sigma factor (sigma-70 family)
MEPSDQELVEQCGAGDTAGFARLVTRYQTLVCSIAYSITGDFARSEDVGQDAFVAAWKQLAELKEGCKFKSWLCSITRHLAHNSMRGDKKLRFGKHSDLVTDASPSPLDEAARNEEQAFVSAALTQLPENYREPLVLFYRQDQSIAEVADALAISPDVVKQRLARGRKLLRDEVLLVIDRTLKRTVPTPAFTVAVLAALPAITSKTAVAATASSTAALAKAAVGAGAWKVGGIIGSLLGGIVGIGGGALGTWASWSTARYQSQRDMIRRQTRIYSVAFCIFMLPFLAMMLGWRPRQLLGAEGYLIAHAIWMAVFMVANVIWIVHGIRQYTKITNRAQAAGAIELPPTPARTWFAQWEGRRWMSQRTLLGRPLVHIAFADPASEMPGQLRGIPRTARGWVAIGDHARGVLLAIGNTAVGPIAIGTMSFGIISVGVVSGGLFSLGVVSIAALALGVVSLGGWSIAGAIAVGYLAAAPWAVGWHAAKGAVAVAFHYADGAKAIAMHAGDGAAKQYFASSEFFRRAANSFEWAVLKDHQPYLRWSFLIVLVVTFSLLRLVYRRKQHHT